MISSILPYLFFFIPEALVLTHPPRELNSTESGQCPHMTPNLESSFSISLPMIPASMQAIILFLSTHLTLFILVTSTETIVLFYYSWHISDSVTFVPPPNGISTTLCFLAAWINSSACSWETIQMTQSAVLGSFEFLNRQSSFREWPWEWKILVILFVLIQSTLFLISSMKGKFYTTGSTGTSLCGSTTLEVSIPMTDQTQSLNLGIFWPEN